MKTIALDFDGVIHRYSKGWHDGTCYDDPLPGAEAAIKLLQCHGFAVCIFSTRAPDTIVKWMFDHMPDVQARIAHEDATGQFWNEQWVVGVFRRKPVADLYVDDRAYRFDPKAGWNPNYYSILSLMGKWEP